MQHLTTLAGVNKSNKMLIVCHGCLVSDVRLFDMVKFKLAKMYSDLIGKEVNTMERSPQNLCSYCAKLLINLNQFQRRCTLALELLENAHRNKMMATDFIKKLDRAENNLVLPYTRNLITVSSNISSVYDGDFEIYYDDKDNVIKSEFEDNEDMEIDDLKRDTDNEAENSQKLGDTETTCSSKINFSAVNIDDSEIVLDTDFTETVVDKACAHRKIWKRTMKNTNRKTRPKHRREDISKKLNVDIKFLSREEQIREIENRKLSSNYKQAMYKCNLCYKGYLIEETYNSHMALHSASSGDLICDICKCRFKTKLTLSLHLKTHEMILTCRECGHVSTQIRLATLHYKFHEGAKYPCEYCSKVYNRRSTYYWHMKNAHASSLLRCELCGDAFNGTFGLKAHERRRHCISRDSECPRCGLQFYTKQAFDAHRRNDDGLCDIELKSCVRCGSTFATEELLRQHEVEQQRFEGHFECSLCNKKFHTLAYYKKHYQKYHSATKDCSSNYRPIRDIKYSKERTGSSSVLCEICGKTTKSNGLLKLHHREKHLAKDCWPHQCNMCPKSFRALTHLQDHVRTHTGERPYHCQLCPKAFNCKQNLKRHNIVHTGERPHSCHICEKRFQTSSCVKVHVKTVHMKIPQPPRTRTKKSN